MADLARAAGLSAKQLGRHFRRVAGVTPRDFLMLQRIQAACELLAMPTKTVAAIAIEVGFCDQSACAYQFRRIIGLSPTAYRNRLIGATRAIHHPAGRVSERCRNASQTS